MTISLLDHQREAISQLKTGSILCGGVGTGKTITSLVYYVKACGGSVDTGLGEPYTPMAEPKDLYVITTAAKRDKLDWEREALPFMLSRDRFSSPNGVSMTVDSWNNIQKYVGVQAAFFIFDEQRLVGSGAWVKAFLKIAKENDWILLSATPGDTWMDYIPVFVANGFYKNRTEFIRRHVVLNGFTKFPKVDHYVEIGRLHRLRNQIIVKMSYQKATKSHHEVVRVSFDEDRYDLVTKERRHPFESRPIRDISELCQVMRKVVNTHPSRLEVVRELIQKHRRVIVFYNYDYELEILRELKNDERLVVAEYNGHKHEPIPSAESWAYLVQYTAGAEGWNCIETNVIVFYSLNYSYRVMTQSAGRIDRLNTPFTNLYYYQLRSGATIDAAISRAIRAKRDFNERSFANK